MRPTPTTTIVLASTNQGKVREFSSLLAPFGVTVLSLTDFPDVPDVEETGTTFMENSLLKSRGISKATGLIAVADDSGLLVDALDGAPGVYSARYSKSSAKGVEKDQENTRLLLTNLQGIPMEQRTGRFFCAMSACTPQGATITAEGAWEGHIAIEPQGHNGFGYDPIFIDNESGLTAANLDAASKNAKSHRGKAVANLLKQWPLFWQQWLNSL